MVPQGPKAPNPSWDAVHGVVRQNLHALYHLHLSQVGTGMSPSHLQGNHHRLCVTCSSCHKTEVPGVLAQQHARSLSVHLSLSFYFPWHIPPPAAHPFIRPTCSPTFAPHAGPCLLTWQAPLRTVPGILIQPRAAAVLVLSTLAGLSLACFHPFPSLGTLKRSSILWNQEGRQDRPCRQDKAESGALLWPVIRSWPVSQCPG